MNAKTLANLKKDLPSSLVVFLVALPLCLGIALASGAPPMAGVIAGIVGGIVVGILSGSPLGVSGPAAGLAVIVLNSIDEMGGYELFLCAVVLSGLFQGALGLVRAGVLAHYFPSSVIKGMLAGIGVLIMLKQVPHAVGYDHDYEGSVSFVQPEHENTFSTLSTMLDYFNGGSVLIATVSMTLLLLWEQPFVKKSKLGMVPGPLLAVVAGIGLGKVLADIPALRLADDALVALPDISLSNITGVLTAPDFGALSNPLTYKIAATMALVGSLETLLCVEAADKLDPEKRLTPTNRELIAQGVGNSISGLLGGLPVTQVIVRSSANIQSGARSKNSAVLHGCWLLLSLLLVPGLLRAIPLASLAAILLVVGFKLAKPALFKQMWVAGRSQFVPFASTIVGVVVTDLLTGVMIGLGIGIFTILLNNYRVPFHFDAERYVPGQPIRIALSEDVSFLNKASILRTLVGLPKGAHVIVDATRCVGIDPDVEEIILDSATRAPKHGVTIDVVGLEHAPRGPKASTAPLFMRHVASSLEDKLSNSSSPPPKDVALNDS